MSPFSENPTASVLVVDDSSVNLELISTILKEYEYDVRTALSGPEALQQLGEEEIDLVLLDLMMPEMNGFEIMDRIRSDPAMSDIPIVVLTAVQDVEFKIKAFDTGADDFMTKPFNPAELLSRVQTHLRISSLQKQLRENAAELADSNRALQEAQEKLIQAEKSTAIVELAGAINHEMNQPFTVLLGQVELLKEELPEEHPSRPRLETILRNVDRLSQIIKKLENIKDYRTKDYVEDTRIVDLG